MWYVWAKPTNSRVSFCGKPIFRLPAAKSTYSQSLHFKQVFIGVSFATGAILQQVTLISVAIFCLIPVMMQLLTLYSFLQYFSNQG